MSARIKIPIVVLFASIVVCATTVAIVDVVHERRLQRSLDGDVDYLRRQLNRNVAIRNFRALHALAQSPIIHGVVDAPRKETAEVLGVLIGARHAMGAEIVYLMDTSGTVVACSPYGNGQTLTGENYSIRPYFIKARGGDDCLYGALGLTTNRRGFYFSVPIVVGDGAKTFVLVAKIGLDPVDRLLQDYPRSAVLKTPSGIIFASNQHQWLFRSVPGLSDEELERIRTTKQFAGEALRPLPFSLDVDELVVDGKPQLASRTELGAPGWELVVWRPCTFNWPWALGYGATGLVLLWGVLVVVYAVRRRSEMQRNLLLSQHDYEAIFNASADAIFIHDQESGVVVEVNQRTCDMYGGTPSDYIGRTVEHISSGEPGYTLDRVGELVRDAAAGKTALFEWHAKRLDGSLFWVEVNLTEMQLKGKRRVMAIVRDVTERHEQVNRLRKLSRAIEESPASVLITDLDGTIEYVNKAFCRITGFPREAVVGKNPRILSSGVHPNSFYKELWDTIKRGDIWTGEVCNAKRDRSLFWELSRIAPILDESGSPTHFVAVKVDISELKKTETMLGEAKRAAENADRAKSTFLANMSHEIRTPMNAIIGFLDLALRDDLSDSLRSNLEVVHGSATELMGLIDNILDTSKLDSGKMVLEDIQFSLADVLDEVAALFLPKANEKGLGFETVLSENLASAYIGDRGKLKQILSNLVGNAIKFTVSGGVTVNVEPLGDDRVRFEVRDTGMGIPADKLDAIFAPFSQGDGSTTRRFGGSGLGTTISRQLVELMGGRIWVRSTEGEGSEFSFEIPLLPISSRVGRRAGQRALSSIADLETRHLTVLMAEDVDANIALAKRWFEETAYILEIARDGVEAVDAFRRVHPDIVLLDIHMPRMDGVEAAREIRGCDGGAEVPILALTASVMKEEVDVYLAAGMDGVIGKPIDFRELFKKIAEVTGGAVEPNSSMTSQKECPSALEGLIDWPSAVERWGDMDFFLDSFSMFVKEQVNSLAAFEAALANGDLSAACDKIHSLKGVVGNLSLTACFESAQTVESLLIDGDLEGLAEPLAELRQGLQNVAEAARSLD